MGVNDPGFTNVDRLLKARVRGHQIGMSDIFDHFDAVFRQPLSLRFDDSADAAFALVWAAELG